MPPSFYYYTNFLSYLRYYIAEKDNKYNIEREKQCYNYTIL